jgi:nitrogenase-associated protein
MTTVMFYEKAGCINNTRQKALLKAAGHRVVARNLLLEPWTRDRLLPFFEGLPVVQWFNTTAPAITTGLIVPQQLDAETALELMVLDPLLIRRPLIKVGQQYHVGFDPDFIEQWIGLNTALAIHEAKAKAKDLETCPRATQKGLL